MHSVIITGSDALLSLDMNFECEGHKDELLSGYLLDFILLPEQDHHRNLSSSTWRPNKVPVD